MTYRPELDFIDPRITARGTARQWRLAAAGWPAARAALS